MAWFRFTEDHDFRSGQTITAYKAGWSGSVKQECADEAHALGRGDHLKAPRKGEKLESGDGGST
jgi:hypothetical protein